jgi:hypothetical protein
MQSSTGFTSRLDNQLAPKEREIFSSDDEQIDYTAIVDSINTDRKGHVN